MNAITQCERVILKIDLETIAKNANALKKIIHPAKIIAVLKADAYGLGLAQIATYLWGKKIQRFAIATAQEAKTLRRLCQKATIYHIGTCLDQEIETLLENDIIISADSSKTLEKIVAIAKKKHKHAAFQLLFDTGMGRLGIPFYQSELEWKKIAKILQKEDKNISLNAVYSHFANADKKKDTYTQIQIKKFTTIKKMVEQTMNQREKTVDFHLSNSSGLMNYAKAYFDCARVGIALYNGNGDDKKKIAKNTDFPATKMCYELYSQIISVRRLAKGSCIGYHCHYTLARESIVATIAAGYCDGIPMQLSGKKAVLVKKEKVLVIGKISMDYTTVLIPQHLKVKVGDKAVFLGQQGSEKITIGDWAKIKNTNPQEILTSLGKRVKREYSPKNLPKNL